MEVLNALNAVLESLGINYEYDSMSESPPRYPYWVGEYSEIEPTTEDGEEEFSIILTGFCRGNLLALEEEKEKIKECFKHGLSKTTESGAFIFFSSAGSLNIPVDDPDLRKRQITINAKYWRGD